MIDPVLTNIRCRLDLPRQSIELIEEFERYQGVIINRLLLVCERSRPPRIREFDRQAVLVMLWLIFGQQAGESLPGRVNHLEVAVWPILHEAGVGARRLRVCGIHLQQRRRCQETNNYRKA